MACSSQCELNGKQYIFHTTPKVTYAKAFENCQLTQGGRIAFANTPDIRTKLFECCRNNDQEFWVAFTDSDLAPKTDGDCPLFKARESGNQQTNSCNSLRKYVCEVPQGATTTPTMSQAMTSLPSNAMTSLPSNAMTSQKQNGSSLLTTTPANQVNVGLIIGAVFAVILLLLLLVALYHFRLRHLSTKKFGKVDFKKCVLGCTAGTKNPTSEQPAAVPQEDHGYYSIRVQEDRSGANSVYSYITEPGNARSTATTPDLRAQHQIAPKIPGFPAPGPPGATSHYETIDQEPRQQTAAAARVIPPPPNEAPPPTPDSEPEKAGSGVTYTTVVVPDEGVSYSTITRVLGDPPTDPYAVVHKDSK